MAYSTTKGKGNLGVNDVANLILTGAAMPIKIETGQKISAVFRKYPDQFERVKMWVELARKQLDMLVTEDASSEQGK